MKNNYFFKEIDQNDMFNNMNKKVCTTLTYIEHFLTLTLAVAVCIPFSAFASLVDISKGVMSSAIGLNIYAIITRIKKYKEIIKKEKKKHDEIALLAKTNLDCTKDSISRSLTNLYIGRNYFFLIRL